MNMKDSTCFLWLQDPQDVESPFEIYRFKVVLFGATCSPFILNATILTHLDKINGPVAENMTRNIYVDNVVTSIKMEEDAIEYYRSSRDIM